MILYFSGTGNSEYVARRIGRIIADEVVDLFEKIRSRDFSQLHSDRPWVVVTPTYAWRIPRIVREWLERTPLAGSGEVYFVMTCGASPGNAGGHLAGLCASKNLSYRGFAGIVMPENYIAMFPVPAREAALEIIRRAEDGIDRAAFLIRDGEVLPQPVLSMKDRLSSDIANDLFYRMFVRAEKFATTGACISCGQCVDVCPLRNIRLVGGAPVWGTNCTHCMACICRCPAGAIEYGKRSRGRPRYVCPKGQPEIEG